MATHYFIGIKVPLPEARSIVKQRDSWQRLSHKRYPLAEDLHITLMFIGGDPYGEIGDAAKILEEISHPSFELEVTGTGHFGKTDRPRVVFGALKEIESLNNLQRKIQEALKKCKLSPDMKPFVPHITLANKWSGKEPWESIPSLAPLSFKVKEFTLFQINPDGKPRYVAIKTYKLKDGV